MRIERVKGIPIMSKQTLPHFSDPVSPAFEAVWNSAGPSLDKAMNAYAAWLSDFTRLQSETLRVLNARLSEDCEAAARLAACKSPTEAPDFQVEYAGRVVSECME